MSPPNYVRMYDGRIGAPTGPHGEIEPLHEGTSPGDQIRMPEGDYRIVTQAPTANGPDWRKTLQPGDHYDQQRNIIFRGGSGGAPTGGGLGGPAGASSSAAPSPFVGGNYVSVDSNFAPQAGDIPHYSKSGTLEWVYRRGADAPDAGPRPAWAIAPVDDPNGVTLQLKAGDPTPSDGDIAIDPHSGQARLRDLMLGFTGAPKHIVAGASGLLSDGGDLVGVKIPRLHSYQARGWEGRLGDAVGSTLVTGPLGETYAALRAGKVGYSLLAPAIKDFAPPAMGWLSGEGARAAGLPEDQAAAIQGLVSTGGGLGALPGERINPKAVAALLLSSGVSLDDYLHAREDRARESAPETPWSSEAPVPSASHGLAAAWPQAYTAPTPPRTSLSPPAPTRASLSPAGMKSAAVLAARGMDGSVADALVHTTAAQPAALGPALDYVARQFGADAPAHFLNLRANAIVAGLAGGAAGAYRTVAPSAEAPVETSPAPWEAPSPHDRWADDPPSPFSSYERPIDW